MNEDRKRAEKIVRDWIEHDLDESFTSDYVGTLEPDSLVERITAYASEVRAEQRERDARIAESRLWSPTVTGFDIARAIRNEEKP